MRWIWIDRFTEFVSGSHGTALKNVTLGEDYLSGHFPGYPVLPPTLMIEGMAQTAGILVGEARGFADNVILAKIREARFSDYAVPGDQLLYHARIESIDDSAAATVGRVDLNGRDIGRVNLMFSYMNHNGGVAGLPEHNFVFTDQFMRLFEAIRDGGPSGGLRS
ncbi:MAG: 3-hydroxyacyl-ACP dehydratase FabZ family protein [Phycisphaerae bacterium]